MFRVWLAVAVFCGSMAAAGEVEAFRADFKASAQVGQYTVKECELKGAPLGDNGYRLEIVRNDGDRTNNTWIQWQVRYAKGFAAGIPYRLTATVKADRRAEIDAQILLNGNPYTVLVKRTHILEPGVPTRVELSFTPKEAVTGPYRVPGLMLGKVEAGTVLEVTDVVLYATLPEGADLSAAFAASAPVAPPTVDRSVMNVQVLVGTDRPEKYRVLFLGNSITRHGPNADLGWKNDCGMAASVPENDYVHRFRALLDQALPGGMGAEALYLAAGGGKLDHHFGRMEAWRAAKADLVVIQLGENDRLGPDGLEGFRKEYEKLVDQVLSIDPKPALICVGVWQPGNHKGEYGPEPSRDSMVRDIAKAKGVPFASVAKYATDPECRGWGEHNGVKWHPNDKGMEGYAMALLEAWTPLNPKTKKP